MHDIVIVYTSCLHINNNSLTVYMQTIGIDILNTTILLSNQNRLVSAKVNISDTVSRGAMFTLKLTPTVRNSTVIISSDTLTLTVRSGEYIHVHTYLHIHAL